MLYFPFSLGQMEEAEASTCSIRQKIQISSAGVSRSTDAEINMVKPPNYLCPASADPQPWRQSVTGRGQNPRETQAGAEAKSAPEQTEELGQYCPRSVSTCQHPFVDSQGKLLEPVLVFSAMLLFFLIRRLVSTYSSPNGSLTVFPVTMKLHNLLSKL